MKNSLMVFRLVLGLASLPAFALNCPQGLFTGNFKVVDPNAVVVKPGGVIADDTWKSFTLLDPAGERDVTVELLRNLPFSIEQQGCEALLVKSQKLPNPYFPPLKVSDLAPVQESYHLTALPKEKVTWTSNSVTFEKQVGNKIFGGRYYKIVATKLANGDIQVQYNGWGEALLPAPLPVYWNDQTLLKKVE